MLHNFNKLLSKKEKKIKKNQFFRNPSYFSKNFNKQIKFMNEEKKWMLMTYYCPTHGDAGIAKPIAVVPDTNEYIIQIGIIFGVNGIDNPIATTSD